MAVSTYPIWGWGRQASDEPSATDLAALAPLAEGLLGHPVGTPVSPAPLPALPDDRVSGRLPASLAGIASADPHDRARHSVGRSYRDVVRALAGRFDHVPDTVLRPESEAQLTAALEWCTEQRVAAVPFGGGTSVVGGVEPDVGEVWSGCVSLDLSALSGLVEVDPTSRSVRVRAGTPGPDFEDALRPHGLTARFYPQSFERSTVGGWIATRAAGHFSTGPTHIDDLVENVRAVTPAGPWESRRLPGSGAGPSPDRALLGSEGVLGVVTEAWLRVQPRPTERWSATYAAADLATGLAAVRAIAQTGVQPATCRLIDGGEAAVTGTLTTGEAALVLGVESWSGPVDSDAAVLTACCNDHGLRFVEGGATRAADGAGASWRSSFLRAPYLREQLVMLGLVVETFETAATWDRVDALVAEVTDRTTAALREVCGGGTVTCRLTHVYPNGAAPYFTVIAPGQRGSELAQWADVKAAASDALLAAGGTITHHHAVGRDHRPWYDRQRPEPFAAALRAAKAALDPAGILNPGVLLDQR
ncbi:MAG TPA: FAD-binding oxidoreductase [Mycobacteriales bacterium]|nr:FAD-binding oxidoreductase [Mycobacteriales bacterium]